MGSTLNTTDLTITVTEQFTSNGQVLNYINQQVISGIKPNDPRQMAIPTTEVPIIQFSDTVGAGQFITANIRYIRITNKDDTNWIRVRLKRLVSNYISTLGSITAGSNYLNGTYQNVALTDGTGTGATADIVVLGSSIVGLGTINPGTGYVVTGTYTAVPLTGGTGSGAEATIIVSGGGITSVVITTSGIGYVVGDVLSASNSNLGGSGSGFSVPVSTLAGGVTSITLLLPGTAYTNGDSLSALNTNLGGSGSGFGVTVTLVATVSDILDKKVSAGEFFIIGNAAFDTNTSNASFVSFSNIQTISAQADASSVDIEYLVASV